VDSEIFELNKDGSSLRALHISAADRIKSGASGTIYKHPIAADKALKLYHDEEKAKHKEKIALMVRVKYGHPHADEFDFAWPETGIVDKAGEFLGFEMPLFGDGWVDLEALMQASEAERDFAIGERERLKIVKNLSRAVKELHSLNVYCIDLKPRNIRVNLTSMAVGIIDCDGMSIVDIGVENSGRFYAAKSTPEFWAPENLGRKPSDFVDEAAHDCFALAVIIFMLLNRGLHPFQGYLTADISGAETTVGKIKNNLYPYGPGNTRILPHRDSLYPFWPDEAKRLFDRAFTNAADRPAADEWFGYFGRLAAQAEPCPVNPQYHLLLPPVGCPVCARNTAPRPQPPPFIPQPTPAPATAPAGSGGTYIPLALGGIGVLAILVVVVLNLGSLQNPAAVTPTASSQAPAPAAPPPAPPPAPASVPVPSVDAPADIRGSGAPTYVAPAAQFTITNNTSSTVHVGFYDGGTRAQLDPPGGRVYVHNAGTTQSHRLDCTTGQLVCYGAVKAGGVFNPYWGAGYAGRQNCAGCCVTCPGTMVQSLNENDARRPTPDVTFVLTNSTAFALSVAFYSQSRAQWGWPDWNRNWTLPIGQNKFSLTCVAQENICYGAWPLGNVNGIYWGVGPLSRFGCKDCCVTCDGNTHVIPPLVTGYGGSE
jgi:hypothetical protein